MAKFIGTTYTLTREFIDKLPFAERDDKGRVAQKLFWDSSDSGFGVLVGLESKTFVVQRQVDKRTVREKLGRFGPKGITIDAAKRLYNKRWAALERGEVRAPKLTLRQAWQDIYKPMLEKQKRSDATITRYWYTLETYFDDWLDRSIASITPIEASQRHSKIAADVKQRRPHFNGEASANQALKIAALVYSRAMRDCAHLPRNPFTVDKFEKEDGEPSRKPIPDNLVKTWLDAVRKLDNRVVGDALEFSLYSGLRKTSLLEMRWSDIDWENKILCIPRPKGGPKAKFALPLSEQLITILRRREREHPLHVAGAAKCKPWVWPAAWSASGHIAVLVARVPGVDVALHELRNTFASVARRHARLDEPTIGTLLNHSEAKKSVTLGYMRTNVADLTEHLRPAMQKVAAALDALCKGKRDNVVALKRARA